jgi:hypothetical protein
MSIETWVGVNSLLTTHYSLLTTHYSCLTTQYYNLNPKIQQVFNPSTSYFVFS